jgi:hypothetical protein
MINADELMRALALSELSERIRLTIPSHSHPPVASVSRCVNEMFKSLTKL